MFLFVSGKEPALNFAANGIVVEIKNSRTAISYFNCIPWSDFPEEREKLFISGYNGLSICGLIHVAKCIDYKYYVSTIQKFKRCAGGRALLNGDKLTNKENKIGTKLVNNYLGIKYNNKLPKYMCDIFKQSCIKQPKVIIDIRRMNNEYLCNMGKLWGGQSFGDCYGYIKWKSFYFDENNNIKFKQISKIFPGAAWYQIRSTRPVENVVNTYECLPSVY